MEPTQYPEKFPPLLYAVAMAHRTLFVIPSLSREVAEIATLVDLSDRPVRVFRGSAVGDEELRRAFKGLRLATEPIDPFDPVRVRDELETWNVPAATGATRVPIDHAFPVKGVGAVALGIVRGGPLDAHARLRLYPTEHEVEVRSVQVHDVEVRSAQTGDRVGVALKGIEAEDLSRGQILAPAGSLTVAASLDGRDFARVPYYRGTIAAGSRLHLSVGLQLVPVKVESVERGTLRFVADRPAAFEPGEPAFVADLSPAAGPRLVGRVGLYPV